MKANMILMPDATPAAWNIFARERDLVGARGEGDGWTHGPNGWVLCLALPSSISLKIARIWTISSEYLQYGQRPDTELMGESLATALSLYVLSNHCYGFFSSLFSKQNTFSFFYTYSLLESKLQLGCCWHCFRRKPGRGWRDGLECTVLSEVLSLGPGSMLTTVWNSSWGSSVFWPLLTTAHTCTHSHTDSNNSLPYSSVPLVHYD